MTNLNIGRWLLVAVAIIGFALAIPVVSAHGTDTAVDDAPPYDGTGDEWATWMETQMNEHMGPGSVEWMESQMGLTVEEMGQDMADDNYNGGMYGQDHC
jgi:hypothetical protein